MCLPVWKSIFSTRALISNDRNDHIIELALLLRSHFAKVYINISRRSHQQLTQQKFSLFAFNLKKELTNCTSSI